ncbi:transferase family-domain-containing protein [Cercophora scortea]|uniref:Transferase family-domain-containing protein n=1 Tax=Cercophora scortea TaxID=314031 RepID=A0AAE0I2A5_9PEZI|nr:transferase family-domain-containing protein [Cercophora scortea]
MATRQELRLHPWGYENDPEEERFPLSTLDYLSVCAYDNMALFFPLSEDAKPRRTLSQCRHLVGTIERNPDNTSHSFVKHRNSTVGFTIQHLPPPFPSFTDLEASHFLSSRLGSTKTLSFKGLTYADKPPTSADAHPIAAAFQANFIPGGLILNTHHHHYANDAMGWSGFVHQLADNCRAIMANNTSFPPWNPSCLDNTRFTAPQPRNPALRPCSYLLFHLPKSKALALKRLATPTAPDGTFISTWDAFSAFLWRTLTKHRAALYHPQISRDPAPTPWSEAVNMRPRLSPPPPARTQGNIFIAASTSTTPLPVQPTTSTLLTSPLPTLASTIRSVTSTATPSRLGSLLQTVAPIRDKAAIGLGLNSSTPLALFTTDWRETAICEADFGFGRPKAFRHLFDVVTEGIIIVYPPRRESSDGDGAGCEFVISVEKEIVQRVVEDEEMKQFFEFRGVEVEGGALRYR